MHPNPVFAGPPEADVAGAIAEIGFARLFAMTPRGPRVAHVPVVRGGADSLRFHLANGNALCPVLDGGRALILADGPNAYVSANWYPDPAAQVPTWNYTAFEAEGVVAMLAREELVDLLDTLAAVFEPRVSEDWARGKMDPARFDAMVGAITGFEMRIDAARATHKLSQNKPAGVAAHIADRVEQNGVPALAAAMRAWPRG